MQSMDNKYITISYNNKDYVINKADSLNDLISRGELLKLPMSCWKEIFEKKDGTCRYKTMLKVLEACIYAYDTSDNVNIFYYKNVPCWLDKNTRVGLYHLATCSPEHITVALGTEIITLPVEHAKAFLAALEVYAGECYLMTAKHLIAIKELKSIEDIVNYDYTKGYPDKISLNE